MENGSSLKMRRVFPKLLYKHIYSRKGKLSCPRMRRKPQDEEKTSRWGECFPDREQFNPWKEEVARDEESIFQSYWIVKKIYPRKRGETILTDQQPFFSSGVYDTCQSSCGPDWSPVEERQTQTALIWRRTRIKQSIVYGYKAIPEILIRITRFYYQAIFNEKKSCRQHWITKSAGQ